MAATFSSTTFLPAINTGENFIKLRDIDGNIRYKIYNNTISSYYVTSNNLIIKTEADSKIVKLVFATDTEATDAWSKFQTILLQTRNNYNIQKDSKFSDASFEIYDDNVPQNFINFDLNNLAFPQTLSFGKGSVIQTETEVNALFNTPQQFRFFDHFVLQTSLLSSTTNSIIQQIANDSQSTGVIEIQMLSTGNGNLWSGYNNLLLNSTSYFSAYVKTTLPNPSDVKVVIGFFDSIPLGSITKAAMFLYDNTLSNNWLVKTMDSVSTIQNTLKPVDSNWHLFEIKYNVVTNMLDFSIDSLIVASINSNIPVSLGSEVGFGICGTKSTANGTCNIDIDYVKCNIDL